MSYREKKLLFISAAIAVVLITVAYFYQVGIETDASTQTSPTPTSTQQMVRPQNLSVGEPGSTHAHATFALLIDGQLFNFHRKKYQLQSEYVHFHEQDGVVIHKHATGVSIPYFLETIGIIFEDGCIILDEGDEYCDEGEQKVRMVVNGALIDEPERYEIQHGDRILLDYSSDRDTDVRVRAQTTVPDVPPSLMEDEFNTR